MNRLFADSLRCTFENAPSSPQERALTASVTADFRKGLQPEPRPVSPASSPAVVTLLAVMLVLLLYNLNGVLRFVRTFLSGTFDTRTRKNIFDEPSASSSGSVVLLMLQLCIGATILIYLCLVPEATPAGSHAMNRVLAGIFLTVAALCLFHIAAYWVVGWTFATPEAAAGWIQTFNRSTGALALFMTIPVCLALFYPTTVNIMAWIVAIAAVLAVLCPIIKGFSIFYHNIFSILYFILYLCTLEIIPVLLSYAEVDFLCNSLSY